MKFYNKLMRKKRAVSPIIAAILLIGLAVLAGAAIFVVVLPMLQSGTNASQVSIAWSGTGVASVSPHTTSQSVASFSVTVTNSGTAAIDVRLTGLQLVNGSALSPYDAASFTAQVGSTDAVANTVNVAAGQTVTFAITGTWATYISSADVKVSFDAGVAGPVSNTFSSKIA